MQKTLLISLAMSVFIVTCISTAHALSIQDGNFGSWVSFSFITDDPLVAGAPPNISSGNTINVASGGNPGAFLQATHSITYGDRIWTGGIKTDFFYDPVIYGAIDSLAINADLLHSPGGSSAWQLVIEQGEHQYYSFPRGVFYQNNLWSAVTLSDLVATNFDTNPSAGYDGVLADGIHPDFSSTALPLQFGFMFGNRLTGPGQLTNTLGLDNFSLNINTAAPIPEPSTMLLFGIGMAGLVGTSIFRRRK